MFSLRQICPQRGEEVSGKPRPPEKDRVSVLAAMKLINIMLSNLHAYLTRAYTEGFVSELLKCFECRGPFQAVLRKKEFIDPALSDRNIFERMPLGDVWLESKMHLAWGYIYNNKHMVVPPSWQSAIETFNKELLEKVF